MCAKGFVQFWHIFDPRSRPARASCPDSLIYSRIILTVVVEIGRWRPSLPTSSNLAPPVSIRGGVACEVNPLIRIQLKRWSEWYEIAVSQYPEHLAICTRYGEEDST
jgi:hypothetical protein